MIIMRVSGLITWNHWADFISWSSYKQGTNIKRLPRRKHVSITKNRGIWVKITWWQFKCRSCCAVQGWWRVINRLREDLVVDCIWNVMAHTQKPDFVFQRKGRVHLNRRGRQFSRLLAAEVCASAVVMLDTPCSEVMWRVLATHSIRQFHLQFPSRASPCVTTFQLDSTTCPLFRGSYLILHHRNNLILSLVRGICILPSGTSWNSQSSKW